MLYLTKKSLGLVVFWICLRMETQQGRQRFDVQDLLLEKEVQRNIPPVTSCVTCYVISNHTSFGYIVDSANEMHLRVIAQPCARVPKML